jgi:hypothetical protein
VTLKKASVGTELDSMQAGVPDVIPPEAPGGTTLKHHLGPAAARWRTGSPRKLEPRRPQVCTRFPRKWNSPAQRQMAQNRLLLSGAGRNELRFCSQQYGEGIQPAGTVEHGR